LPTRKVKEKNTKQKSAAKKAASTRSTKKVAKAQAKFANKYKNVSESTMKKLLLSKSNLIRMNEQKAHIARDMLERYTGHDITKIRKQVILTNFHYYVERFNTLLDDVEYTVGSAFKAASSEKADVTIIEFGIGSAMAALVMELVSSIEPKAVLFLGLCGGIHDSLNVGDFILPIAAIRAEGVSRHFLPPQVPALPTFKVQKFVSQILVEHNYTYRTGSIHSTDLRFWEFNDQFKENLYSERVLAVEMETAALFVTGFINKVNIGALLLVSDMPLKPGGIKTKASAKGVFRKFTDIHIELGIEAMADIAARGEQIRHYEW
jgi:AMP nucleosidase